MSWSAELGVPAVAPAVGAVLRLLAATSRARTAVEVGTGTGVSALWLLRGMAPDGVLTSIDIEPEYHAMARQSFAAAGFEPGRTRLIAGAALEVLPRLADDSYDLVFIDGEVVDYPRAVSAAHRLLRASGIMILNNALIGHGNRAADPRDRARDNSASHVRAVDEHHIGDFFDSREFLIVRELVAYLLEAPEWESTILTVGNGLLCATKAWPQ
jgi:predicted O-methyltransferase YrrM